VLDVVKQHVLQVGAIENKSLARAHL
jgi:hypothetical protein